MAALLYHVLTFNHALTSYYNNSIHVIWVTNSAFDLYMAFMIQNHFESQYLGKYIETVNTGVTINNRRVKLFYSRNIIMLLYHCKKELS